MRSVLFFLLCFISVHSFSQEAEIGDEFLPINLEGKEAFLSTKTGEYVYRSHADTDVSMLKTTDAGVIYTDIKIHTVAKRENISKIAKKYGLNQDELMTQNNLTTTKLSIGQELKIIKKIVVESSSPVISQEEPKIIARLNPGQTPTGLDAAPPNRAPMSSTQNINTQQVEPENNDANFHTVVKGDNLYNIAKKHNITVETLMKVNNLTSNNLSIGQKLKLK
ncbi:LysM peptidoglycan-binding domain-containing protein [Lacinutrix iliipiscaria]|uniref:LysM peptidoglycan-binding domain-containing protein n=1 Tax=Lacinutrix iliipiscaria TaxID=1230532 RepID=A0ABW5WPT1_9FLAO